MSNYVGVEPRINNGIRDYFTGNGVLTSFPLSSAPGGANGIIVAISGVIQKAGVSYFVTGKTLTFSEAPPAPLEGEASNIEVIYLQRLGVTPSVNWKMSPVASNVGTVNALSATYTPAITALTDNLMLFVVVDGINTSNTPTFSPNGLPAATIVNYDGTALPTGTLKGTVLVRYSTDTSKWVMCNDQDEFGVTPPQFDISKKLATTEFVQQTIGSFSVENAITVNTVLTAANAGQLIVCGAVTPITATLPLANTCPSGTVIHFQNSSGGPMAVAAQGANSLEGFATKSVALGIYDTLSVQSQGGSTWRPISGSGALKVAAAFGSMQQPGNFTPGYQKLPSGLILQWITLTTSATVDVTVSLPVTFSEYKYAAYATVADGNLAADGSASIKQDALLNSITGAAYVGDTRIVRVIDVFIIGR